MIVRRLRDNAEREQTARELYAGVVKQARQSLFYADYGVPDSLDGRFEMIALHAFLLLHRLKSDNPEAAALSQAVYDVFFADMDQCLREMGAGDLGRHFPDTDVQFKDIASMNLLEKIKSIAEQEGFYCVNIDATIVVQEPKIFPYVDQMAENISQCLKTEKAAVNIKAKTTEGLGFEGRGEGISAYAVVLMEKKQ